MLSSLAERLCCYYFDNTTRLVQPDTINNPNRTLHALFSSVSQKQHLYALMVVEFFIHLLPVGSPYESCYRRFQAAVIAWLKTHKQCPNNNQCLICLWRMCC